MKLWYTLIFWVLVSLFAVSAADEVAWQMQTYSRIQAQHR